MLNRAVSSLVVFVLSSMNFSMAAPPSALPDSIVIPNNLGTQWGGDMSEADVERIGKELGVKWLRIEVGWSSCERVKGQYDFAGSDKHIALLAKHGLWPLVIFDYGNPIYQKTDNPADDPFTGPSTPEAREGYANFAAAAAKHFAETFPGLPIVYEIWNEPDYQLFWRPRPDVQAYVELVKATAPRIRAAVPGAIVIGPGTMSSKTPFITRSIELGILEHLDAFSVHPYRRTGPHGKGSPETVIPDYQKIRDLMSVWFAAKGQMGRTLPLIESEWGYSETSLTNGANVTEIQQAEYLARMWLIQSWLDVRISIWFQWKSGDNPADVWSHFGMLRNDGSDRLSFKSAKVLVDTLRDCKFVERIDAKDDALFVLKFLREATGETVYAIWTSGAESEINLPLEGKFARVSLLGEKSDVSIDAATKWKVDGAPVYLTEQK